MSCTTKLGIGMSLTDPEYWETQDSKRHHQCRLIALNKVFLRIPRIDQYRPICVLSPPVKFLEGYIIDSLREYGIKKLNRSQFGFVSGKSIDHCK
jgi:hypothetical protein